MEVRQSSACHPLSKLQTELGELPSDWSCSPLGDVTDILTGFPFPSAGYADSGIRLLRGSNVKRGQIEWREDLTAYWPEVTSEIRKYLLKLDDVVVAMDGSLVGRSFGVITEPDLPALLLQRVARIRSITVDIGYLKHWICSERFTAHCDAVKTTTAIPHISPADIRSFKVAVPPSDLEQRQINRALSDTDSLIETLEQLLSKKRQAKQGAMQQLLAGDRRLPGFTQPWTLIRLGDIGRTYGGLTGKSKPDFGHGSAKFITFMNVMTNIRTSQSAVESVDVGPSESQNLVQAGDLLFNGSSEIPEEVAFCSWVEHCEKDVFLNSFCFGFRPFDQDQISGLFMAYFFRARPGRMAVSSLAQGATRYNIAKTALLRAPLKLPDVDEQNAIAETLLSMDEEINALEARLTKARDLKQAMAQALLTGRIRLMEPTV